VTVAAASGEDRALIERFLEMMAAEAGAARNTLAAYGRDLAGASESLGGKLAEADAATLKRLGEQWLPLARSSVARKSSALRRFFAFLAEEKLRPDNPSDALPRPGGARPLPRTLDHGDVDRLFAEIERRLSIERSVPNLRLSALVELLYDRDYARRSLFPCRVILFDAISPISSSAARAGVSGWCRCPIGRVQR